MYKNEITQPLGTLTDVFSKICVLGISKDHYYFTCLMINETRSLHSIIFSPVTGSRLPLRPDICILTKDAQSSPIFSLFLMVLWSAVWIPPSLWLDDLYMCIVVCVCACLLVDWNVGKQCYPFAGLAFKRLEVSPVSGAYYMPLGALWIFRVPNVYFRYLDQAWTRTTSSE